MTREDISDRGREADAVRRSAALPLTWDVPDEVQIEELVATIRRLLDRRRLPPKRPMVEAIALIMLTLQTGMDCDELHRLVVRDQLESPVTNLSVGLVRNNGKGLIVMSPTATEPEQPKAADSDKIYRPVLAAVVLPQTDQLQRAIDYLMGSSPLPRRLFTSSLVEIYRCSRQLMRGGYWWRKRTSKATRSFRALGRWLRHRLRVMQGGDPALFSILDPNVNGAERTLAKYFTVGIGTFWRAYRAALLPVDPAIHQNIPSGLEEVNFGCPTCPADQALRSSITKLQAIIARPIIDPRLRGAQSPAGALPALGPLPVTRQRHIAMMMYTQAMVTFGTGQRGIGRLVGRREIDTESGFAWVVQKSNPAGGYSGERGVYHCKIVQQQLAAYDDYVDEIYKYLQRLSPELANGLAVLRDQDGPAFFDIRNGRLKRVTQSALCHEASDLGWKFGPGAGRKWLRSSLSGMVPSDALAAQFGHHHDGLDVWGDFSGLAPTMVATGLASTIMQELTQPVIGFMLSANPKRRPRVSVGPDFSIDPVNNRCRAGQILASAIWNGSYLDLSRDAQENFLECASTAIKHGHVPEWFDMTRKKTDDYRRWFVDPTTKELMERYRRRGMSEAPATPKVLAEYFGTAESTSAFLHHATLRWRFRLPPIIHAWARGGLANHSSSPKRFDPFLPREKVDTSYRQRRWANQVRPTCDEFVKYLENFNKIGGSYLNRKKFVKSEAEANIELNDFWKKMSKLEKSIAIGLIRSISINRGKFNTVGYSIGTTIDRAFRIWRDFVPVEKNKIDEFSINELTHAQMRTTMVAFVPWNRNVEADIVVVLKSLPLNKVSTDEIKYFENLPQNYTVELVRPDEYATAASAALARKDGLEIYRSLVLCYRSGFRFSELRQIFSSGISSNLNNTTVIIDHRDRGRLKTFHSRRRVPLDVLLDEDELAEFRHHLKLNLMRKNERTFSYGSISSDIESEIDTLLRRSAEWAPLNAYYLRHSFATNNLAAVLWPSGESHRHMRFFGARSLEKRKCLRDRLCGPHSLGAVGPYAIATVMGHTSPWRTLFSYVHNLEVVLAAHVAQWTR